MVSKTGSLQHSHPGHVGRQISKAKVRHQYIPARHKSIVDRLLSMSMALYGVGSTYDFHHSIQFYEDTTLTSKALATFRLVVRSSIWGFEVFEVIVQWLSATGILCPTVTQSIVKSPKGHMLFLRRAGGFLVATHTSALAKVIKAHRRETDRLETHVNQQNVSDSCFQVMGWLIFLQSFDIIII